MKSSDKLIIISLWALLVMLLPMLVAAETTHNVHVGQHVTRDQVIQLLAAPTDDPILATRGLRLHEASDGPVEKAERSLSLEVFFDFDSANLTEAARAQLSPVGEALVSQQLVNIRLRLEGHTDAAGTDSYNMVLSRARAEAVRQFFVDQFDIEAQRIAVAGKGESDLLNPQIPLSAENRRVQFIAY